MHKYILLVGIVLGICITNPITIIGATQHKNKRIVRVVYFIPTDRQPAAHYAERLDRVMTEVQRFYQEGMKQNGYGDMTFQLERDSNGKLLIHRVHAKGPMKDYGRNDAGKVRGEVKEALAKQGINIDRETVIIFQLLLEWRGNRAVDIGPYVGGWNAVSGTAYVYDDEKLDPRLLGSKKAGGYYNGPCSWGEFNSHYIGGVAHELGHAFGLPHDREKDTERPRKGLSLMGAGNHVYGREKRGEGKGAFLSAVSALPLSVHPLFTGKDVNVIAPGTPFRLEDLDASFEKRTISLSGRLAGEPNAVGIAAHNDSLATSGDYDAVGWTCSVNPDGTFQLKIGEIKPGKFRLRLRAYRPNGTFQSWSFAYQVDDKGQPDLSPFISGTLLSEAVDGFRQKDKKRIQGAIVKLQERLPEGAVGRQKANHLLKLLSPTSPMLLSEVPKNVDRVSVPKLQMEMSVGWGQPLRDQVLMEGSGDCFLEVGNTFFTSGLYAHAPAKHVLRVDKQWKKFASKFGLQDGHDGSVVFVVLGDGKELFRSEIIRDHRIHEVTVNISSVKVLEMCVENAGDGNGSDWGVWLNPELLR